MCLDPKPGVEIPVIAPAYPPEKALQCENASKMSSVFTRKVLKALGRPADYGR